MKMENLNVVKGEHSEEGVLLEYWTDDERRIAVIDRTSLDDIFDPLLPFGVVKGRRFSISQWNAVVDENLDAFGRIILAKHETENAAGRQTKRLYITHADIQRSGEGFSRVSLRSFGIASA
jgi:hypothetical protein